MNHKDSESQRLRGSYCLRFTGTASCSYASQAARRAALARLLIAKEVFPDLRHQRAFPHPSRLLLGDRRFCDRVAKSFERGVRPGEVVVRFGVVVAHPDGFLQMR